MSKTATPHAAQSPDGVRWLPTEHLGQFQVEASLRHWLIGKGLLTQRLKSAAGDRFRLRLVGQWTSLLSREQQSTLRVGDGAGLFREVELCCGNTVWVFAQTIVPDSTLSLHPWLAELGDASLGETLGELSGVARGPHEYARLPADDALASRALRDLAPKPEAVWARRARILLHGAPLLVQELFLPAIGRT